MFILSPHWFKDFHYSIFDKTSILEQSDDILISGMLEFYNIPRIQLGPYTLPNILPHYKINSIHTDKNRFMNITVNAIEHMQKHLLIWTDVNCQI